MFLLISWIIINILFYKLGLFNRHHLLLFKIFITALVTSPFTTALFITALVTALFICSFSTVVLAFAEILGYCLFHNCLQVLKKLASNVLRKFFAPEDAFNPLNLAKLEKLYLVQVKIINNTTAFLWGRNAGKYLVNINWHPFHFPRLWLCSSFYPLLKEGKGKKREGRKGEKPELWGCGEGETSREDLLKKQSLGPQPVYWTAQSDIWKEIVWKRQAALSVSSHLVVSSHTKCLLEKMQVALKQTKAQKQVKRVVKTMLCRNLRVVPMEAYKRHKSFLFSCDF